MIKTITTTGGVNKVEFNEFFRYFWIKNKGVTTLKVSSFCTIETDVDNVAEIAAGEIVMVENYDNYNCYILGAGAVEIHAQNTVNCPFKVNGKGGEFKCVTGDNITVNSAEFPLINLNVYGRSIQDGTPATENPVDIISIGDNGSLTVTTCGKNLIPYPYTESTASATGWAITSNADGGLTFSGTPTGYAGILLLYGYEIPKSFKNSRMSLSLQGLFSGVVITIALYDSSKDMIAEWANNDKIVLDIGNYPNAKFMNITAKREANNMAMTGVGYPQLEFGSTATPYESYQSTAAEITTALPLQGVPVSSGGNYTDSNGQEWVCDELIYNADSTGKIIERTAAIESYNGENIQTAYISTTGSLDVGATVVYALETPTEAELTAAEISALLDLKTFDGVTNIFNSENADMLVKYCTSETVSENVYPMIQALKSGDTT